LAIEIIRLLNLSASKSQIKRIELFVSPEVADYLQNEKRAMMVHIEQLNDKRVIIHSEPNYVGEKHKLVYYNQRGSVVKL
jgi:Ribonuclease G/E